MSGQMDWGIRQVLEAPRYRWFLLAYFLDELCNALWLITLGWVIARTDTDLQAAAILLITAVPLAVVLVTCSGWIDRKQSPNVALVTLALRAVLMCIWVAVATADVVPFAMVAVVGGLVGAISGIHEPAMTTYPLAVLPSAGAQAPAVVLERVTHRMTQAVGGVTAGALIGSAGLGAPAALGAGAIMVALFIIFRMNRALPTKAPAQGAAPSPAGAGSISGGISFVRAHRALKHTLLVQALITVTVSAVLLVTLPFRVRELGWSSTEYGLIMTCYGVGMAIATASGLYLQRVDTRTRVLTSCALAALSGAVVIAIGLVGSVMGAAALMGLLGLCLGPAGPFLSGYLRSVTAEADAKSSDGEGKISGRVAAVMILATDAMEPVGYALAIGVTLIFSVSAATVCLGAFCLVMSGRALVQIGRIGDLRAVPVGT